MKVTLWQQFSSNHSANFMVVGQFESVEWAQTVGAEIQTMLQEISDWWSQYEGFAELELAANRLQQEGGLTPPEKKYAAQFQVKKWGKGRQGVLDWVQSKVAVEAVSVYENLVIINQGKTNTDTWAGATPFDEILRKLGAKVAVVDENLDHYFAMNLTCRAPDEATTSKIVSETILETVRGDDMITLPKLYRTRGTLQQDKTILLLKHYQFHDFFYRPIPLSDLAEEEKRQVGISAGQYAFIESSFEEEFQRILDYLKSHSCTDIRYEFVEVPFGKADG